MFSKIKTMFSIPDLRKKILLTLGLLAIYRLGWNIFLPMIDTRMVSAFNTGGADLGDLLNQVVLCIT